MSHVQQSQPATATQPPLATLASLTPPVPDPIATRTDFGRMSPAEMIAWMEAQPPQAETGYKDPVANRLQALGAYNKADRRSNCGSFMLLRCPNGHRFRSSRYRCQLRLACPCCGETLARDSYHKWEATMTAEEQARPEAQITFLEISQPLPRDREAAMAWYRLAHNVPFSPERPMWTSLLGYHHDRIVMRALIVTEQRPLSYWQAIWPDAEIRVSVYPIYKLREVFRDQLVTPLVIRSPKDRADQEVLFTGVRMFRAFGIRRIGGPNESTSLSVTGLTPTTDNDHRHDHMTCPECGKKAIAESQWFPPGAQIPSADKIRWRRVT